MRYQEGGMYPYSTEEERAIHEETYAHQREQEAEAQFAASAEGEASVQAEAEYWAAREEAARMARELDKEIMKGVGEGIKHDSDVSKLRYDLFPASLAEVAKVYTLGARKYADRNWERGMTWGRLFRAMIQHAFDWWWGIKVRHGDGPDKMHSLASVAWYALALMEYENTHQNLDDRPYRRDVERLDDGC